MREDDKRLFDIMVKSYYAARYKDEFEVEQADADQIFTRVSTFLKLTEIIYGDKIKSLATMAESYIQLKKKVRWIMQDKTIPSMNFFRLPFTPNTRILTENTLNQYSEIRKPKRGYFPIKITKKIKT